MYVVHLVINIQQWRYHKVIFVKSSIVLEITHKYNKCTIHINVKSPLIKITSNKIRASSRSKKKDSSPLHTYHIQSGLGQDTTS